MIRALRLILCCPLLLIATGCMLERIDPKAKPATDIDEKFASSNYWFNQPATVKVQSRSFDALWNACEQVAQDSSFTVERTDYRNGFITTKPLVSKQVFEFWKHDVVDARSQLYSDTTTHRRVIHFQILKKPDGGYVCEPKVVVEHYAAADRRITGAFQYLDVFSVHRAFEQETTDEGTPVRLEYWYAERRDENLERELGARIRRYLKATARVG